MLAELRSAQTIYKVATRITLVTEGAAGSDANNITGAFPMPGMETLLLAGVIVHFVLHSIEECCAQIVVKNT